MKYIDSKKKKLSRAEIITRYLHNEDLGNTPLPAMMLAITRTLTMPNAKVKQIGNTVFFMYTSPAPHQDKLVGGAYNADTPENFIRNGIKFIDYLKKNDYSKFISDFSDKAYLTAYRVWEKKAVAEGMLLDVVQKEDGTYRAIIVLDPDRYGDLYRQGAAQ